MRLRSVCLLLLAAMVATATGSASLAFANPCSGRSVATCGGVTADQPHGDFHGLIAVTGHPDVLAAGAHAGSQPGCGDCVWTLLSACPHSAPNPAGADSLCHGAVGAPNCPRGVLERLYLSDQVVTFELRATLCLRAGEHVVPVGDLARADVDRYLKNVRPPRLAITTKPGHETLAGLPTYFTAAPPRTLGPHPFGGGQVTEAITLAPIGPSGPGATAAQPVGLRPARRRSTATPTAAEPMVT